MEDNKTISKLPAIKLLLIGIVIIAFFLYWMNTSNNNKILREGHATAEIISRKEQNKKVADFVSFVEDEGNKMRPNHKFTHQALVKLSQAINSTAGINGYEIHENLEKVRALAANITKDSLSKTHADNIRKAAEILTDALQDLQKEQYPWLNAEVKDLRLACVSINPNIRTLNQKESIKSFFNKAANLLQKMK